MEQQQAPLEPSLIEQYGMKPKLSPILGIFLTVFLDLLSFGLFFPDLQLRGLELAAKQLGSNKDPRLDLMVGFTLAVFSIAQLITAPILGRISDKHGRRKVLLLTTLLSVSSYLIYANALSWPWIVVSRVLSGIAAANVGVAFAYVADITKPEERAKGLGSIGAAFGMGFILGPVTGAFLLKAGNNDPHLLGYVAAALAALNFLYVVFILPESRRHTGEHKSLIENYKRAFSTPGLALMLILFFATNFAFTNLETTYFRLLADPRSIFHLGDNRARMVGGAMLAIVGVVAAIMQGGVVRRVTPIFGEVKLIRVAYWVMGPALALVPFMPIWVPAIVIITFLGIGSGLAQPSLSSLISRSAPKDMQGGIFGITQGLGAVARCTAPLASNLLFGHAPAYPYFFGAALLVFPALGAWKLKQPKTDAGSAIPAH